MNSINAEEKLRYIDELIQYFENLHLEEELQSHVAKYLTVIICGIYENIIRNYLIEYVDRNTASEELSNFILHHLKYSLRTPKYKNITDFLVQWNQDWVDKLNRDIEDIHKEALFSIVENKNTIAHGDSLTLTFTDIKDYYENSRVIIEKLDEIILS